MPGYSHGNGRLLGWFRDRDGNPSQHILFGYYASDVWDRHDLVVFDGLFGRIADDVFFCSATHFISFSDVLPAIDVSER